MGVGLRAPPRPVTGTAAEPCGAKGVRRLTLVALLSPILPSTVVRGSIQNVTHEAEKQESTIHLQANRLYRQKNRVFRAATEGGGWQGQVTTLLECGVRPGSGQFLFTGHIHFGEAQLGCAPRFLDFQRMYRDAVERGLNPCEMDTE